MIKEIGLPCYGMVVRMDDENPGNGSVESDLHEGPGFPPPGIDAIESMVLAHACAGVDIESPAYIEGIETAVEAVMNHGE